MVSAHNPPPKNAIRNHIQEDVGCFFFCFFFLGSRRWRVSVMSAYLSLSPLLHFVLKFSIQKIKGGGKTSERAGRGREERKVPSWISSWILCQSPPKRDDSGPKSTIVSPPKKTRTFYLDKPGLKSDGNLSFADYNLATRVFHTRKATTLHTTLAMLLSELMDSGGDVRTTTRFVVNIVVKRWERYNLYLKMWMRSCAHVRHEKWQRLSRENNALHNA